MPLTILGLIALGIAPFAIYFGLKRPLIFPVGLYVFLVPFDGLLGASFTVTRVVALACVAALLLHMLATRRVLTPPKSWVGWAAYVLLATLSVLWTIDPATTSVWISQLLQLFLFFTILAIFPAERNDVRLLGAIIVASGLIFSAFALVGYAEGFRTQGDRLSIEFFGSVIDPNHIAASLLLPSSLAVGAFLETRDIRLRAISLLSAVCMVSTLFLTGSRGGLIAVAVMFLYLAWRTRYRLQILGFLAIAGLGSLLQPTVWNRFADKGLTGGSGREYIWDVGKLAFKDHWFAGAGFGGFEAAYNHELLSTYQPLFQGWSRPAHNALLSAAVETGAFGAVLLTYAFWRSWKDARGNAVIEASIVGLIVASFFLDVITFKYIWLAFSMATLVKNAAEPKFLRGSASRSRKPNVVVAASAMSWYARRTGFTRRSAQYTAERP